MILPTVELIAITPNAEHVCETAARCCYRSETRYNTDNTHKFLQGLIAAGHESVIEHASAGFKLSNISRALSHQLVRHRHASYSQESQRYCKTLNVNTNVVMPESFDKNFGITRAVTQLYTHIEELYNSMLELGIPKEDARYILPNACTTTLVMSANFRQWRHMLKLRLDKNAQWEIRIMFKLIFDILVKEAPAIFSDLQTLADNSTVNTILANLQTTNNYDD